MSAAPDRPIDSDGFMMWVAKVELCPQKNVHCWTSCPFAHQGEKARRRDLRQQSYISCMCPSMKQDLECPKGDACPYSHNVFEYYLHPERYRTVMCTAGPSCDRAICFFAHTPQQLRRTSLNTAQHAGPGAPAAGATDTAGSGFLSPPTRQQQQQQQQQSGAAAGAASGYARFSCVEEPNSSCNNGFGEPFTNSSSGRMTVGAGSSATGSSSLSSGWLPNSSGSSYTLLLQHDAADSASATHNPSSAWQHAPQRQQPQPLQLQLHLGQSSHEGDWSMHALPLVPDARAAADAPAASTGPGAAGAAAGDAASPAAAEAWPMVRLSPATPGMPAGPFPVPAADTTALSDQDSKQQQQQQPGHHVEAGDAENTATLQMLAGLLQNLNTSLHDVAQATTPRHNNHKTSQQLAEERAAGQQAQAGAAAGSTGSDSVAPPGRPQQHHPKQQGWNPYDAAYLSYKHAAAGLAARAAVAPAGSQQQPQMPHGGGGMSAEAAATARFAAAAARAAAALAAQRQQLQQQQHQGSYSAPLPPLPPALQQCAAMPSPTALQPLAAGGPSAAPMGIQLASELGLPDVWQAVDLSQGFSGIEHQQLDAAAMCGSAAAAAAGVQQLQQAAAGQLPRGASMPQLVGGGTSNSAGRQQQCLGQQAAAADAASAGGSSAARTASLPPQAIRPAGLLAPVNRLLADPSVGLVSPVLRYGSWQLPSPVGAAAPGSCGAGVGSMSNASRSGSGGSSSGPLWGPTATAANSAAANAAAAAAAAAAGPAASWDCQMQQQLLSLLPLQSCPDDDAASSRQFSGAWQHLQQQQGASDACSWRAADCGAASGTQRLQSSPGSSSCLLDAGGAATYTNPLGGAGYIGFFN